MFSGIVDHCGKIAEVKETPSGLRLKISARFEDLSPGESIAVDGVCLTVTEHERGAFFCDVSPETLRLTILGSYRAGHEINLEQALRLSDRIGGHFVMGHVDQVGEVLGKRLIDEYVCLNVGAVSSENMRYLIQKGSVAVNGVSLTVNNVFRDGFEVMLIPHTRERTNLGFLGPGDKVNLEFDWMAKLILQNMSRYIGDRSQME